jgi:hypothetical protein
MSCLRVKWAEFNQSPLLNLVFVAATVAVGVIQRLAIIARVVWASAVVEYEGRSRESRLLGDLLVELAVQEVHCLSASSIAVLIPHLVNTGTLHLYNIH